MNLTYAINYLIPGAKFAVLDEDYDKIEWMDERKQPTREECEAVSKDADAAAEEANKKAIFNERIAEIDNASVSDLREFVTKKFEGDPNLPADLMQREAEAEIEKEKLK